MFSLAECRGARGGVYCDVEGLYLGPSALIELHNGIYRVRPPEEIAVLLGRLRSAPRYWETDAAAARDRGGFAAQRHRPGDGLGRIARFWKKFPMTA